MSPNGRFLPRLSLELIAPALLVAALAFTASAFVAPHDAYGATSTKVALCGVNLRSSASGTARIRAVIKTGARATVVASLTGTRYRTTCANRAVSGTSWYRISALNGRTVRAVYGVSYLYAAAGLFGAAPVTKYALCSVKLRSSASTTATVVRVLPAGGRVTVVASVAGPAYHTTCSTRPVSGSAWYRISAINGTSVRSLYGISYVNAAAGLFGSAPPAVAPAATPTPTPRPTPTPTPTPVPTPPDTNTSPTAVLEGVDVSHWQYTIDWTKVAAASKKFAFIKATEATDFLDGNYATNRSGAKAAGLKVGAYHFAQPSTTAGDAVAEADWFIDQAAPRSGDLRPVLDLERVNDLSTAALQDWVRAFLERVYQRTGVRGIIYVSPNFWKNNMGDTTWFAQNDYDVLWIANWTTGSQPTLPANAWGAAGWTFWQYTSDGAVPGIDGQVDLDRFNGTDLGPYLVP